VATEQQRPSRRWLGLHRAARRAGVHPSTLHRAVERGEVVAVDVGGSRLFHAEDVDAWGFWRRAGRPVQVEARPMAESNADEGAS
jgi:excisionase family DNA binding protein